MPPCRVYKQGENQHGSRPQEVKVSASVLYMSMSLDGYIAGPNDEPGNPGGDGFDRLHEWGASADGEIVRPSGPAGELFDEMDATGAVLAGRRTAEQIDHWKGDKRSSAVAPPGRLQRLSSRRPAAGERLADP
jgi:dihydrofolate reductase